MRRCSSGNSIGASWLPGMWSITSMMGSIAATSKGVELSPMKSAEMFASISTRFTSGFMGNGDGQSFPREQGPYGALNTGEIGNDPI